MKPKSFALKLLLSLTAAALWGLAPTLQVQAGTSPDSGPGAFRDTGDDGSGAGGNNGSGSGGGWNADPDTWDIDNQAVPIGRVPDAEAPREAPKPAPVYLRQLLRWFFAALEVVEQHRIPGR